MLKDVLYVILDIVSLIPIIAILGTPIWLFLFIRWVNKYDESFDDMCARMREKLSKEEYEKWYEKAYKEEMASLDSIEKAKEWTSDDAYDWEQRDYNDRWNDWQNQLDQDMFDLDNYDDY